MRLPLISCAVLASLLGTAHAADREKIGSAIKIQNTVTATLEADHRRLNLDDPVHQNEVIEVATDSLGELKFVDDTKIALGAGSRVVLDKYVYDPSKSDGSIIVNMIKGTFRFFTGVASKPTYKINTPAASISVRGTIFDVSIRPNGDVWILLIEGSLEVCTPSGRCRIHDQPGHILRITNQRQLGIPIKWTGLPGHESTTIARAFPFIPRPPSFDPTPIYTEQDVELGTVIRHPPRRPPYVPPGRPPRGTGKYPPGKTGGKTGDGRTPKHTPTYKPPHRGDHTQHNGNSGHREHHPQHQQHYPRSGHNSGHRSSHANHYSGRSHGHNSSHRAGHSGGHSGGHGGGHGGGGGHGRR